MYGKSFLLASLFGATTITGSWAHEYWIEPLDFAPALEAEVSAHLKVGGDLVGDTLPFIPQFAVRYDVTDANGRWEPKGEIGDRPALTYQPRVDGLNIVAYQTKPSSLNYTDPGLFQRYLDYEGLDGVMTRHLERGFELTGFREDYSRFVKSLVDVGNTGEGADEIVGLRAELVALDNPYSTSEIESITVQLLWETRPQADTQINLFTQTGDAEPELIILKTDQLGYAEVDLQPDTLYLLNSVHMEEADPADGAAWESFWASLTFKTP